MIKFIIYKSEKIVTFIRLQNNKIEEGTFMLTLIGDEKKNFLRIWPFCIHFK